MDKDISVCPGDQTCLTLPSNILSVWYQELICHRGNIKLTNHLYCVLRVRVFGYSELFTAPSFLQWCLIKHSNGFISTFIIIQCFMQAWFCDMPRLCHIIIHTLTVIFMTPVESSKASLSSGLAVLSSPVLGSSRK